MTNELKAELVACLKEAIETCREMYDDEGDGDPIARWRAAIARAEGGVLTPQQKADIESQPENQIKMKEKKERATESFDPQQRMFVSEEDIGRLRKLADVSGLELNDDKALLDFCKGALQNFKIKKLRHITTDEFEKLDLYLRTRTPKQKYVPLKERVNRRNSATETQDDQPQAPTNS